MQAETILLADDEADLLELYDAWLDDYTVRTATSGEEVLEKLDDSVSVVVLDRRMQGLDGASTLDAIRDRDSDCRIVIVSAVEPSLDDAELEFDDYVIKPTTREELTDVVETLTTVSALDSEAQRCFRIAARRAVLERSVPREMLESDEEYVALCRRLEALEDAGRRLVDALDDDAVSRIHLSDATAAGGREKA